MRPSFYINSKKSVSYNEISAALVNHESRKKDKQSFIIILAEVLAAREISFNQRKEQGIYW